MHLIVKITYSIYLIKRLLNKNQKNIIIKIKKLLNKKQENIIIKIKKKYRQDKKISIIYYHLKKKRNDTNIIKNDLKNNQLKSNKN